MKSNLCKLNYSYQEYFTEKMNDYGTIKKYMADDTIYLQYSPPGEVFFVADGLVRQYFLNEEGKNKTLLILGTGDFFGEITYFQGDYDTVNTSALTQCSIIKVPTTIWNNLLNDNEFKKNLFISMTTKIRILMYQIYDSTYYDSKQRLLNLIMRLALQRGKSLTNGYLLDFTLTHEDLSIMINTTRSTVSRNLKSLITEGKILKIDSYYFVPITTYEF